jgi:type II secretory pathway component GspD/PulD (secretin)
MSPKWLLALGLSELIATAGEVTGEPFFYEPKDIEKVAVRFTGTVKVPREEFLSFFDRCLRDADFLHLETKEAMGTAHTLRRLGQQVRGSQQIKNQAPFVTQDELAALADRSATLVSTTFTCKNLPAREAVTTLAVYFSDAPIEVIRNIEGTDTMVMSGYAQNLHEMLQTLRDLDARAGMDEGLVAQRDLQTRVAKLEADVALLTATAGAGGK